jgi:FkbM family methyltransferase
MNSLTSHQDCYLEYIKQGSITTDIASISRVSVIIADTNWENPTSSSDWNNIAVMALIEAEKYPSDTSMRSLYLEMALDALNNGYQLDGNPLCAAHLALIDSMIGETEKAIEAAFSNFITALHFADIFTESDSNCLLYLFSCSHNINIFTDLSCNNYKQALVIFSQVLCHSQLVFYNTLGRRFLHLAAQVSPHSSNILLQLGISSLLGSEWEGLIYIHRARQFAPNSPSILHSLYLAYRDLNQIETANYWLDLAKQNYDFSQSPTWKWASLPITSKITYINYETDLVMAVESSFKSIVTSVLIAQGEWFEKEMEFWRNYIKPGMTVIDVGANAGVYTFSAALKVGSEGRVLAVEPFSGCVNCLQETCQINNLSWVTVCAGAASDFDGNLKLRLHNASELNEVISSDDTSDLAFEEIPCFTLDTLMEKENLTRVDILKIDAENHEIAVLKGSGKLLSKYAPVIIYENIAGSKGSNYEVAEYLTQQGYQLYRYQPYLQNLIPVDSLEEIQDNLNLIAFPSQK